jgi:hypothetical protein
MVTLSVTRSRVAAVVARLRRRPQVRTSPTDPFDALLAASVETGGVITVPGIAAWLGRDACTPDPDFTASIDGGFTESFEDYCERISRTEVAS